MLKRRVSILARPRVFEALVFRFASVPIFQGEGAFCRRQIPTRQTRIGLVYGDGKSDPPSETDSGFSGAIKPGASSS